MAEGLLTDTVDNSSQTSGETTDIFASVPREVRFSADGNDKLARFAEGGNTALATSYLELEKMDSGKIKMPTNESSSEELSAFYQKLPGNMKAPDSIEGYGQLEGDNIPEGDKAYFNAMANAALESGMSVDRFQNIVKANNDYVDAKITADTVLTEETLQREWLGDYDKNIEIVERIFRETDGGDEAKKWFNASGGGRNAETIKWLLEIGKSTLDDTYVKGEQVKEEVDDESEEGIKAKAYFAKHNIAV